MIDRAEAERLLDAAIEAQTRFNNVPEPLPEDPDMQADWDAAFQSAVEARAAVLAAMTPPLGYKLVPHDALQNWMDVCDRLAKSRGARLADLENVSEEIGAMLTAAPELPK